MQQRTISAAGIDLAVLEAGEGGKPFLLVHGFTGAKEDFADHLDALAGQGWHCVAPDLRGHGGSAKPAERSAYSLATMAADLTALADALAWDGLVLLGHSMGGMVAQHVALAQPHRLGGLVLMDTSHGPVEVDAATVEAGRAVVEEGGMAALVAAQRDAGPGPLETPSSVRVRQERPGHLAFEEGKALASADAMWLAMIDELMHQDDRLAALAGLAVPTLVIAGDEDAPFLPAARRMAATIPDARLEVIPDAGHSPQFENPRAWWEALTGFLADLNVQAPA